MAALLQQLLLGLELEETQQLQLSCYKLSSCRVEAEIAHTCSEVMEVGEGTRGKQSR